MNSKEDSFIELLLKMTKFQHSIPQSSFLPRKIGLGFQQGQTSNREIIKDIIKKKHKKNIEKEVKEESEEVNKLNFIDNKRKR